MRAVRLTGGAPTVASVPASPHPGEAWVRVRLAGVCATDLELVRGYMGFEGTLGHEFVGEVADEPGPGIPADARGRRVVADINCPCGTCLTCKAGRPTHCPHRTVLGIAGRDGVFAEFVSLPVANLHPVPDGVPDGAAVFVEPLAAACEILEQVHIRPSTRIVVLGAGRLGQLCARVLALTGAEVTAVARSPQKRALLPAGVTALSPETAAEASGADVVVECTGHPAGLSHAAALVRPRGTIVLKSTVHRPPGLPTDLPDLNRWVIDEVTVVGSRCGPFEPALRLLASGAVNVGPLVTARYALSDAPAALSHAARPGAVKVLIDPAG
jgi:alcohol dehydrogenase